MTERLMNGFIPAQGVQSLKKTDNFKNPDSVQNQCRIAKNPAAGNKAAVQPLYEDGMTNGPSVDAADFRAKLVELLPRLRRFCMALARGQDAGDDLCQAAVERALSRAALFDSGTRLDSWMYRIAQNIHIDQIRRHRTRGVEVDVEEHQTLEGENGIAIVEGRSDLACAEAALNALPDDQRALMALVVLDGASYREAADILDIPIGTVMSRIARARRAIDRAVHAMPAGGAAA